MLPEVHPPKLTGGVYSVLEVSEMPALWFNEPSFDGAVIMDLSNNNWS